MAALKGESPELGMVGAFQAEHGAEFRAPVAAQADALDFNLGGEEAEDGFRCGVELQGWSYQQEFWVFRGDG